MSMTIHILNAGLAYHMTTFLPALFLTRMSSSRADPVLGLYILSYFPALAGGI